MITERIVVRSVVATSTSPDANTGCRTVRMSLADDAAGNASASERKMSDAAGCNATCTALSTKFPVFSPPPGALGAQRAPCGRHSTVTWRSSVQSDAYRFGLVALL